MPILITALEIQDNEIKKENKIKGANFFFVGDIIVYVDNLKES